jgi:hypothetical protein
MGREGEAAKNNYLADHHGKIALSALYPCGRAKKLLKFLTWF